MGLVKMAKTADKKYNWLGGCLNTSDDSENPEGELSGKARRRRVAVATRRSRNKAGSRMPDLQPEWSI
jgi:hypothetical protein